MKPVLRLATSTNKKSRSCDRLLCSYARIIWREQRQQQEQRRQQQERQRQQQERQRQQQEQRLQEQEQRLQEQEQELQQLLLFCRKRSRKRPRGQPAEQSISFIFP